MRELSKRGVIILRCSNLYSTEPWGGAEGGDFLNAVLEIERSGAAQERLLVLQQIEAKFGRAKSTHYEPRRCDLDLLLWGDETMHTPDLEIPHPRIAARRFVLVPLCDLIPDGVHPGLKKTFRELLDSCSDPLAVRLCGPANLSDG